MSDPVALVTGASRGLGSLIAGELAASGYRVVGLARSEPDAWVEPTNPFEARKVCDVTDESQVKRCFSELRTDLGRLDLVINNAGAFSGDLLQMASADRFSTVQRGNLVSAHLVTREAVKLMRRQNFGRVISMSSIAASIPLVGNAIYASGKRALEDLMAAYALEFRGSGITFNSIAISFVEATGMVDALKPHARAAYEARLLVPQALGIGEIVAAISYLASASAAAVTGQVIALGSPY